jgi:hypothetical protein
VVADEERAAFRGACVALGVPDRTLSPLDFGSVPLAHLNRREAMLTYCAGAWIVLADAVRWRSESNGLEELRRRLRLDLRTARMLEAHARWVRVSTDLPWHREFDRLLTEAAKRLDQLEAHTAAA